MAVEIERKFLVKKEKWNSMAKDAGSAYQQGYLLTDPEKTVRVRLTGEGGFITIKGKTTGASRPEYEYRIPQVDAAELLELFCTAVVTKRRYKVVHDGRLWEVDEFSGPNEGLILAEVELQSEADQVALPEWVAEEVTGDERYYNARLSIHPFKSWSS